MLQKSHQNFRSSFASLSLVDFLQYISYDKLSEQFLGSQKAVGTTDTATGVYLKAWASFRIVRLKGTESRNE